MDKSVEEFRTTVINFADCWNQIDMKTLCLKIGDFCVNLITSICLEYVKKPRNVVYKGTPNTDKLKVIHAKLLISKLEALLKDISDGNICFNNHKIKHGKLEESGLKWPSYFTYCKYLIGQKYYLRQNNYTNLILNTHGADPIDRICRIAHVDDINREIRKFPEPYENLNDFMKHFLGFKIYNEFTTNHNAFLVVAAPIKLFFTDKSNLSSKKLHVEIKAELLKIDDNIRIKIINHKYDGETERKNFPIEPYQWETSYGCFKFVKDYHFIDSRYVKLFLEYRDELIDELEIENPRMLVHTEFDTDLKLLGKLIKGKINKRQTDFEIGIAWLLHLCGLSVINYGSTKVTKEGVDIVAFTPSNLVFIVECTTDFPDKKDKLSKLYIRTKQLKKILSNFTITPLLFTNLAYDEIPSGTYEKAESMGIHILANDGINKLIELSCKAYPLKEVLNLLCSFPYYSTNF